MRRPAAAFTALGVALGSLVLAASPAAADSVTVGPLDTSTPGHVRGTVTTDAPGVVIWSKDNNNAGGIDWVTVRNHPGGPIDFDLSTWGIEDGTVRVFLCDADASACDGGQDVAAFTAHDVAPATVTWPGDTNIGEEPYVVHVTDAADGGGSLWVSTASGPSADYGLPAGSARVARDGTATVVPLADDGQQTLQLLRCDNLETPRACRPTGFTQAIDLDREIWISSARVPTYVSTSATFDITFQGDPDHPESSGTVDLDWQLGDGGYTSAASGTVTGLPVMNNKVTVTIPTADLPEGGAYIARWTPHATNAAYGRVNGVPQDFGSFIVDHTPPTITALTSSATTVYPVFDHYRDYVNFHEYPGYVDGTAHMEIWDATGTKRLQTIAWDYQAESSRYFAYTWHGRRRDGSLYPAGSYRTRAVATDQAGNVTTRWGPTVTVVRKHLSARDWTRTVTAKGSQVAGYTGGCSRLRSPSGHGWTGSLGLLSRYYCSTSGKPSLVKTVHEATAPSGTRYGDVSLAVYGGSSRNQTNDSLELSSWHGGQWYRNEVISTVRWHEGAGTMTVGKGRLLHWEAAVAGGRRYDVGSYRLHMRYWVLVND